VIAQEDKRKFLAKEKIFSVLAFGKKTEAYFTGDGRKRQVSCPLRRYGRD